MICFRAYTVAILAVMLLGRDARAQKQGRGRVAAPPPVPRAQPRAPAQRPNPRPFEEPREQPRQQPREQNIDRLSRMTPQQREKALAGLPPERRAKIDEQIQGFQKLPPAAQERTLQRLERLNSLPPDKQNQVRRSIKQFNQLPDDRKAAINQEMQRISAMPEEERRTYLSSDEFRAHHSPAEQKMMDSLSEILPAKE